ncbi:MAG: uroporphyrinogen-III synthase [Crocinitomicaceae bacterium]
MIPDLFISRDINEDSIFLELEANIFAASQIQIHFNSQSIDLEPFDWIFFSSKNAVKWALMNSLDLKKIKIGSIGGSTADFIEANGLKVDYKGADEGMISSISKDFNDLVDSTEKVLFPLSSISKKSILSHFNKTYEEVIAYQTEYDPILFDINFDILVFTSPSNFRAFFSANQIQPRAQIIAIGETTKAEISKYLNISIFTPKHRTENAIYELLKQIISTSYTDY